MPGGGGRTKREGGSSRCTGGQDGKRAAGSLLSGPPDTGCRWGPGECNAPSWRVPGQPPRADCSAQKEGWPLFWLPQLDSRAPASWPRMSPCSWPSPAHRATTHRVSEGRRHWEREGNCEGRCFCPCRFTPGEPYVYWQGRLTRLAQGTVGKACVRGMGRSGPGPELICSLNGRLLNVC